MPVRDEAAIRGIIKPLFGDVISNWAEAAGAAIPMATCARALTAAINKKEITGVELVSLYKGFKVFVSRVCMCCFIVSLFFVKQNLVLINKPHLHTGLRQYIRKASV